MRFELDRLVGYTDTAILDEIRRVADLVDEAVLTMRRFDTHAKVRSSTVLRRSGGWETALVAAGLSRQCRRKWTNEAMLAEVRRVAATVQGRWLSMGEFDRHAQVSSVAVQSRFGGWGCALTAAGLGYRYNGPAPTFRPREIRVSQLSSEEIIRELQRVAREVGTDTLTTKHLRKHSVVSYSDVVRRFGSWESGLRQAGLHRSKIGRRYSKEAYFDNLLRVWTHLGRQPRYGEMNHPPSAIRAAAYVKRFGRWTSALVAFQERMNEPQPVADSEAGAPKGKIRPGLRWRILNRDGFRCVKCGRKPAPDQLTELHVDHKDPKGPTQPDNLRILCASCNIGKGDQAE